MMIRILQVVFAALLALTMVQAEAALKAPAHGRKKPVRKKAAARGKAGTPKSSQKSTPRPPMPGAPVPEPEGRAAVREEDPEPHSIRLGYLVGALSGKWKEQPADGQFRLLQYGIPKAAGDTAPALFIVFHFGKGGGGGVGENMNRWMGMMRQAEGVDVQKAAKRDRVEREGMRLSTLDLAGTYLERPFPRSEEFTERPNYRMLAAVIETTREDGDGPYFVRLVGPAKSIAAAKADWDFFLSSLKTP